MRIRSFVSKYTLAFSAQDNNDPTAFMDFTNIYHIYQFLGIYRFFSW